MNGPEYINDNVSLFSEKGSLSFGTDAYLLSAYARKSTLNKTAELGCGNGVISLLMSARGKAAHITAFEIQPSLAAVAAKNVAFNRMNGKIDVVCADIKRLDKKYRGGFGAVIANPPYLKTGGGEENESESERLCRREICGGISEFALAAGELLSYGGLFTCVYRPDRLAALLCALKAAKLEPKRLTAVYPTSDHVPCLILCEAKKNGAEGMFFTKPLIIYESKANMTPEGYSGEMKYIYEHGEFDERYKNP